MHVIILRGCSGSGKSTWTKNEGQSYGSLQVFSTDSFFEDEEGNYNFDFTQLGPNHGRCLKAFVQKLQMEDTLPERDRTTLVVDNTNTTSTEIAPYAALALAYNRPLKVVTLLCDPLLAHSRNRHDVPLKTVKDQSRKLLRSVGKLPKWWPETVVNVEGFTGE